MLVYDGIYTWEGFGGKLRLASGRCRLRMYDLTRDAAGGPAHLRPVIVIVSDVPESRMSVRSCAGHIATCVSRDFKIDPHRMMYIEHVPASVYGEHQERIIPEKYEAVDFNWTEGGAIQPKWRTLQPPLVDVIRQIVARSGGRQGREGENG
jgi:hypothetical protein